MPWMKVDDRMAFHRKVLAAKNEAVGAWVRAGSWSCGEGTNGDIPRDTALTIAPQRVWDRLVLVELAHETESGWEIHDYLDYNPPSDKVDARRAARSEAGRLGGQKSGASRRDRRSNPPSKLEANDEAKPKQTLQQTGSKTEANSEAEAKQKRTPIPIPIPIPEDPPIAPVWIGAAPEAIGRLFDSGTAGYETAAQAYETAVSGVTGAEFSFPSGKADRDALLAALNKHSKARTVDGALLWLRTSLVEWIAPQVDRATFTGGWSPRHFAGWLNGGRQKPTSGQRREAERPESPDLDNLEI